jgi:hypothetical protein
MIRETTLPVFPDRRQRHTVTGLENTGVNLPFWCQCSVRWMKEATHYPPISYCAISFPYHEINSDYDYVTDVLVHYVVSCCFNSTLARPWFLALRLVKVEPAMSRCTCRCSIGQQFTSNMLRPTCHVLLPGSLDVSVRVFFSVGFQL